jgi:hypothetical protein
MQQVFIANEYVEKIKGIFVWSETYAIEYPDLDQQDEEFEREKQTNENAACDHGHQDTVQYILKRGNKKEEYKYTYWVFRRLRSAIVS